MKNVLCYGDSNTYGVNPFDGGRWPKEVRWPGVLQKGLGNEINIIEEGLGGRTTVWDDPLAEGRNGRKTLTMLLDSHKPLDLIIIMLGTNDLKERFQALPEDIACGVGQLASVIRSHFSIDTCSEPEILLVSPIHLGKDVEHSVYSGFRNSAVKKSELLAPLIQKQAELYGCLFFDASLVAAPNKADMLHMDEKNHAALATAIQKLICL
ncbi:MAG TPA: SGNH/GDSL hydrolase family protein [Caproicibacter sp.]|nr:SGNH/GDSL hydrolase family protein [Caproicibacter sp.]